MRNLWFVRSAGSDKLADSGLTFRQSLTASPDCDIVNTQRQKAMKLRFASMPVGLAVGVTAVVLLACAGSAYLYSIHHMRSLLATAQDTALAEGNLIRVALEHQMIENDRTLIAAMIDSFRQQENVGRLVLLDRYGKEQYAPAQRA